MSDEPSELAKEIGHEPLAISARIVAYGIAVLMLSVIVALLLMGALMWYLAGQFGRSATVGPAGTPIAPPPTVPMLQADQPELLNELRARENKLLKEYAWIDQGEGVARIPIHRAMQILAEEATPPPQPMREEDESAAQ